MGWLSALLGNLAFHLEDPSGARVHLATAVTCSSRTGDSRLAAWAWGARAMVARAAGEHTLALEQAERGMACVPSGLPRAQLQSWARLPSLAELGRERDADDALAAACQELDADAQGWAAGRFGFDAAEHALHEADAQRALGRAERAVTCAERSLRAVAVGTPGWAAAALVMAQAEALSAPSDAAQRALDVLTRVPAARLRSTSRARLMQLACALDGHDAVGVEDLRERARALPPSIDAYGAAVTA
ncbi:hypothetical protein [Streptomyces lydicus]|uniref:hypothetical protein n=1 Tax=Streptomyces lydicus TaxID=47763 RepID=UPI0036EF22BF